MSGRRIWGIVIRHLYNFRRTYDRLVDAFYWPALDIVIWGLTFSALAQNGQITHAYISSILFSVIMWYALWRGQYEITVNLLEELWSENLVNLLSTPLSLAEWVTGLFILGFLKLFMTVAFTALVAFLLYQANIFSLGLALVPFLASLLLMGWAFGLFIAGLFLRFGTTIQTLAWAGGFLLMPFSAVYYPLVSLPKWIQQVAMWLPSSYIFEGMRQVLFQGTFSFEMVIKSFALDGVFLVVTGWFFYKAFQGAQERGIAHIK